MTAVTHPTKEAVRAAMERHRMERVLPTPEEYRRELGWFFIQPNKAPECAR
jgi:hypothetical protein